MMIKNIEFIVEHCCECGIPWAMTEDFKRRRLQDRANFYCPSGHAQHYTGKSEEQKLKDELKRKEQMLEAANARARLIAEEKAKIAKSHKIMRTRVMNGVCPCCNRTFQNLLNHMKTQHPEFSDKSNLSLIRQTFGMTQAQVANEVGTVAPYISNYECGRNVPEHAKNLIETWIEAHIAT